MGKLINVRDLEKPANKKGKLTRWRYSSDCTRSPTTYVLSLCPRVLPVLVG